MNIVPAEDSPYRNVPTTGNYNCGQNWESYLQFVREKMGDEEALKAGGKEDEDNSGNLEASVDIINNNEDDKNKIGICIVGIHST